MRSFLLLVLLLIPQFVFSIVIEDNKGRSIECELIELYKGQLKILKKGTRFDISLSNLSDSSQKKVHEAFGKRVRLKVTLETLGNRRVEDKLWNSDWGSYIKQSAIEKSFKISISTLSSYQREVEIEVFVFDGVGEVLTYNTTISKTTPFTTEVSGVNSMLVSNMELIGKKETIGHSKIEVVVLVWAKDGSLISSEATLQNLGKAVIEDPVKYRTAVKDYFSSEKYERTGT